MGPGVALGAVASGLPHRPQPLRLMVGALQLLGEALRVGRRHQHPVDPVGDDVAVAGDRRGDDRGAGGEGLGQDHAEALAGERGGAEQVGLVQRLPQLRAGDAAGKVDEAQQLRVGQVAEHVLALGADHGQPAGHVLDQGTEGGEQDRQPLALLGAADESDAQLVAGRLRPGRGGVDVDAVGDDLVAAAKPAPAGPGGRLGDGDPGREPVEEAAGANRVGDVVGEGLGRVGVEGADDRGAGTESRVPADQRHHRLVDVDDVEVAVAELPARRQDAAGQRGREVGDGAVGADPDRAPERGEVIRQLPRFGRRPVQGTAEPIRRIEGSEDTHVVAPAEKLLGKRLNVPVHAPLVGPGIWRDESYAHALPRVEDRPAAARPLAAGNKHRSSLLDQELLRD